MADLLETVQRDLRARLDELRPLVAEAALLDQALKALSSDGTAAPRKPRAVRRTRLPRARRGATRARILNYVKDNPGSTAGDIANALGLPRNSTGTRLTQLAKAGALSKAERGYIAA